jgi:hypothetical protein
VPRGRTVWKVYLAGLKWLRVSLRPGVRLALRHIMRVRLLLTLIVLLGSARVLTSSGEIPIAIAEAESCPVRLETARLEPGSANGLRIKYVIHNPQGKTAERLIVTAATVDRNQQVTAVRIASIDEAIEPRSRTERFVTFPKLVPVADERLVVGVQAVGWSGGSEWRGVVRLAGAIKSSGGD